MHSARRRKSRFFMSSQQRVPVWLFSPIFNATIPPRMPILSRLFVLLLIALPVSAETVWMLDAADWARPRHGEWLASHPPLVAAIDKLQQTPHSVLQLRYPGGDEGALWVGELQAWLVALGLESERIEKLPGSSAAGAIQLEVVTGSN